LGTTGAAPAGRSDQVARRAREVVALRGEQFLNAYHNASTPPPPDVPAELANFMLAADPVLAQAAELARVISRAHQGAATQLIGEGWSHARKYFSLSEKYAAWADYRTPAKGVGIHAYAHKVDRPLRLTDLELRAHPAWQNFGDEVDDHPPMRGWLAVPLIGSDGMNYGFIQGSDRVDGDFTEQDEANLVRLATLTATALDALAQLHLPEYRAKIAERKDRNAEDGRHGGSRPASRPHRRPRGGSA
jgi:GAF domain-containing protein